MTCSPRIVFSIDRLALNNPLYFFNSMRSTSVRPAADSQHQQHYRHHRNYHHPMSTMATQQHQTTISKRKLSSSGTGQVIPLSVTIVIVTVCLIIISITVSSRLLSTHHVFFLSSTLLKHIPSTTTPHHTYSPIILPTVQSSEYSKILNNVLSIIPASASNPPKTDKKFILYRTLGNDLPPRHSIGQTYDNVKFILENEPKHVDLAVRWHLNRIVDTAELHRLIILLNYHHATYTVDLFNVTDYITHTDYRIHAFRQPDILRGYIFRQYSYANVNERRLITDAILYQKNQFIIHNNHARNIMLKYGLSSGARYILPWDGNCFLSKHAWKSIHKSISSSHNNKTVSQKYYYTPMVRITNNSWLLNDYMPKEVAEEPQLIFRNDSIERFNESLTYGCRPKVDLLRKLKVPGNWTGIDLNIVCYELGDDVNMSTTSIDVAEADSVSMAGWVARLFSGKKNLEISGAVIKRGLTRTHGVENVVARAGLVAAEALFNYTPNTTTMIYDRDTLNRNLNAYQSGTTNSEFNSLIDKLIGLAVQDLNSNDKINNETRNEYLSRYAIIHTFAGLFTGDSKYLLKSRNLLAKLFLDENTRAPIGVSSLPNIASSSLLICAAFDMAKLHSSISSISTFQVQEISKFAKKRSLFYDVSIGRNIREAYFSNDHIGSWIEVASGCSAAFLGDGKRLMRATAWARPRLWTQDLQVQGLVAWTVIAEMARKVGVDVWEFGRKAIHGGVLVLRDGIKDTLPTVLANDDGGGGGGNATLAFQKECDQVMGEYVWWMAMARYENTRGGFWADSSPVQVSNLRVAASVYQAPPGVFGDSRDADQQFLVPPFWNIAM